jgi:hypothetical protein
MSIVIEAPGTFVIGAPSKPNCPPNGACTFVFDLIDQHKCPDAESSSRFIKVDSAASFFTIPQLSTLQGCVLYLRTLKGETIDVRVTHTTQGATVYPVRGLLLLEVAADEKITLVEVQGVAEIEYAITGTIP